MQSRRSVLSRKCGSSSAKKRRRKIIADANLRLNAMDVDLPNPHVEAVVGDSDRDDKLSDMAVDEEPPRGCQALCSSLYSQARHSVFAACTKPVDSNKYKKRLGAKQAKKLEIEEN